MSAPTDPRDRPQSLGEEIANGVSHGLGLVGSIAVFPVLVVFAARRGDAIDVAGACVFATTLVLLYCASTLYHALPHGRAKRVFLVLDHGAIYLLIAGTYTPFTLGALRGAWGWSLFGVVWGLAALGVTLRAIGGLRSTSFSTWIYLAMGWLVLVAIQPLTANVPPWGIFWLVAGGVAYTVGAIFFVFDRVRYVHFVWHLFVLAGSACHVVAALLYAT